MTDENAYSVVKMIVIALIIQLVVIFYVFITDYRGRIDAISSQRAGCERAKLDRNANAQGWRIAQLARTDSGDTAVAAQYRLIAEGLEKRARVDCNKAFPMADLLP